MRYVKRQILVRKPVVKRPTRRPRSTCENHIKMDIAKFGCEFVDRIHLALNWWAVVNMVMNIWVS